MSGKKLLGLAAVGVGLYLVFRKKTPAENAAASAALERGAMNAPSDAFPLGINPFFSDASAYTPAQSAGAAAFRGWDAGGAAAAQPLDPYSTVGSDQPFGPAAPADHVPAPSGYGDVFGSSAAQGAVAGAAGVASSSVF